AAAEAARNGHGGPIMNIGHQAQVSTRYMVECYSHHHLNAEKCEQPWDCQEVHIQQLSWRDWFDNLVVTAGLDALLNNSFNAVAANVNWYVGLIDAGTGTVAITSGAATVTGTSTAFANGDNGHDLIIVGAGSAGADQITTVSGNPASATSLT